MNIETLNKTANTLNQISNKTADEYKQNFDIMLAEMNLAMTSRLDIHQLVGDNNIDMMRDNHANHLRFMASIFRSYSADVFVSTVLWVFRAYRSHGFKSNYWAAQINCWLDIFKNKLSDQAFQEIYPYYEWIQINIPILEIISDDQLSIKNSEH